MRKPNVIPGEYPLDNTVIEQYVTEHKRATLRKLRPMDMYDVWVCSIVPVSLITLLSFNTLISFTRT